MESICRHEESKNKRNLFFVPLLLRKRISRRYYVTRGLGVIFIDVYFQLLPICRMWESLFIVHFCFKFERLCVLESFLHAVCDKLLCDSRHISKAFYFFLHYGCSLEYASEESKNKRNLFFVPLLLRKRISRRYYVTRGLGK
jgi:hypothetical protein